MACDSNLLEGICLIDTPGILAGHKKSTEDRGYNFLGVLDWFAERADRILVLFDAHKLDISDEFNDVLKLIKPHTEKTRIILNKADLLPSKDLLRIYGGLMWSLGKTIRSPEASKIYISSFWDQDYHYKDWTETFEEDRHLLFEDIRKLPQQAASRKIGELTKRAKLLKAYSLVINELIKDMPMMPWSKEKAKADLITNLDTIYKKVEGCHDLAESDFPNLDDLKAKLSLLGWDKLKKVTKKDLDRLDKLFEDDIPKLVELLPDIGQMSHVTHSNPPKRPPRPSKKPSNAVAGTSEVQMPPAKDDSTWIVKSKDPLKYKEWVEAFQQLNPVDGKVDGKIAKRPLQESGLPKDYLKK